MRYNVLTYLIGEGFANIFKNKKQAFTSIGTMCLTMLIFGIFFVIGENMNHFIEEVEEEQGIQVFMITDPVPTQEQIDKLKVDLQAIDGVNTIKYVSSEDAVQYLKDKMGSERLEGFSEEKIPISYIITLTDLSKSRQIQSQISSLENVDSITSSNEALDMLVKIAKGFKVVTYVILICLVAFAVFIITNTIKLTVYARRKEISIMKYVGATNSFIRWPFAVEGIIIGIISGGLSIGVLAILYSIIVRMQGFTTFLSKLGLTLLAFSDMLNLIIIVYLILGIGIGVLGSTISMRKYLKV